MRPPLISLLCLPCAGASAAMYARWRRLLPEWIQVIPVELPGRGSRFSEAFVQDHATLVAQLCQEQAQAMRGRHALFGHSMGARLAYGIAHHQHELGRPMPRALFASACPAPSWPGQRRFPVQGDDEGLIADLRKQGGTPDEVFDSPELLRMTLDTLGADYRVCESFRYGAPAPLAIPVHALGGRDDDVSSASLSAWQREGDATFSLTLFDGGHFFLRQQETQVLAAIVRELVHQFSGLAPASHPCAPVHRPGPTTGQGAQPAHP